MDPPSKTPIWVSYIFGRKRISFHIYINAWVASFPNCAVTHLPRFKFDHRPFLLSLRPSLHSLKGQPSCFLAGWIEHPDFSEFIQDKWSLNGDKWSLNGCMVASLSHFTDQHKSWNNDVYGHIGLHKKKINSKTHQHSKGSRSLQLEIEVREELDNVLQHEELIWKQKARCD